MNAQNIEYNSATPKGLVHENTLGSAEHRTRQTCGIFSPVFGRGEQTGNACCLAEPRFSTPRPPVILEKVTGGTSDSFRSTIMAKSISSGTSAHQDSASKIVDRFMAKVEKTDSCWLWTAYTLPKMGYGMFWMNNTMRLTHRVSFEFFRGPIGDLHVLHRCDNPRCVNPDHLFLGTNADNVADKVEKNRSARLTGEKHPSAKLNEETVRWIRSCPLSGAAIARSLGLDRSTGNYIRQGKLWGHVQ